MFSTYLCTKKNKRQYRQQKNKNTMTESTQTYEQLQQDIALQLKTLKAKLKVHANSKADKPESWVPIADLNRIKQALDEAVIALAYIEL